MAAREQNKGKYESVNKENTSRYSKRATYQIEISELEGKENYLQLSHLDIGVIVSTEIIVVPTTSFLLEIESINAFMAEEEIKSIGHNKEI